MTLEELKQAVRNCPSPNEMPHTFRYWRERITFEALTELAKNQRVYSPSWAEELLKLYSEASVARTGVEL